MVDHKRIPKQVIVGVSGGIAAYKACTVVRQLTEASHRVRVIPTESALRFVGAATFEALSGEPVCTDGVEMRGSFSRFHVGGNSAVHGGVLPLLFDHMFGMISHAAGRPISRTAFLHVDYRRITPIDVPLIVRGRVTNTEGRKAFVCAELFDSDETLLAEGNGLMVRLLPGQP